MNFFLFQTNTLLAPVSAAPGIVTAELISTNQILQTNGLLSNAPLHGSVLNGSTIDFR